MVNIKVKAELEILEEIIFLYITINKIQNSKKFGKYKLPITEKIYNGLVRLPLYPSLKKSEIKRIVFEVNKFIK